MKIKKIAAILLIVMLMLTVITSTAVTYNGAAGVLSYSFAKADKGFAQGTITLSAPTGTYYLYWADDAQALSGYNEIAKLSVTSTATYTMAAQTAIPPQATKLIAIAGSSEPAVKTVVNASAVYDIPVSKRLGGSKKYSFASYSDIHIDGTYNTYKYADLHWEKALKTASDRGVDFIIGSGDYTNNDINSGGIYTKEWRTYQKILAQSDYCNPIYEAIGNHELWQGAVSGTKAFINATGLEGSNNTANNAYYEKTLNGDHFIFMSLEGGFYPDRTEEFSDAQLNWLEGLLKKYSGDGKNIYIVEHSLFYKYGAGDRTDGTPYYDIPLSDDQASTRRFKSLLEKYKDTIFISGHTHIAFSAQLNFSDNNGTSGQMLHNSSVGGIRKVVSGGLDRNYKADETEGYIVDVYDDGIVFNGANLYYNTYDPNCCYLVRTSQQAYENMNDPTAPTQPATQVTTATQPATTANPTAYSVKGSFNGWKSTNPLYETSDSNIISTTINIDAGTHKFKIYNSNGTWYGNDGKIEDTTLKTSKGGWEMTTAQGDCTLIATGGYYTFNFNLSNNKLTVLYSETAPTDPATEPSTATTAVTKPSETTEPETPTPPATAPTNYTLGDVNGDDEIDIRDATLVQRFVAKLTTFSDTQTMAARVCGDNEISIKDATAIQRYVAKLIVKFPAETTKAKPSLAPVGASLTDVKANLDLYYRYSSYDCYQSLKKAYKNGADSSTLEALQNELLAVVDPANVDSDTTEYTLYFENTNNWSEVYAYCWKGGTKNATWPGVKATYIGKNKDGKSIYSYKVDTEKYSTIIFTNNSTQTVDIAITDDNLCYYLNSSSSPYSVKSYTFKSSYIA